jgi:hypothetical protein
MAIFGPDAGDPNEPWAQRVNPGLTLPVSHLTDIKLTSTLTNIEVARNCPAAKRAFTISSF